MQRVIPYIWVAVFLFANAVLYSKSAYASCTPPSSGWTNATTLLAQITLLCLAGTLIKRRKVIVENRRVYHAFSAALIFSFIAYITLFYGYLEKTFPIEAYARSYKDDHFFLKGDYSGLISRLYSDAAALLATAGLFFLSRYKMLRSAGGFALTLLLTAGLLMGSLGYVIATIPQKLSPPCCPIASEDWHRLGDCPERVTPLSGCKACAVDLLAQPEKAAEVEKENETATPKPLPHGQEEASP